MQSLQRVHTFKTIASTTTKHLSERFCHVIATHTCLCPSTTAIFPSSVATRIRSSQHGPYGGGYWSWCIYYLKRFDSWLLPLLLYSRMYVLVFIIIISGFADGLLYTFRKLSFKPNLRGKYCALVSLSSTHFQCAAKELLRKTQPKKV